MQQTSNTPTRIDETTLDDISGGPHFRNFHGVSFDFQAAPGETGSQSSGHYTQMVWANTR